LCITLRNINQFSKFFHWWIQEEICYKSITTYPTTPHRRCCTTMWSHHVAKITLIQKCSTEESLFWKWISADICPVLNEVVHRSGALYSIEFSRQKLRIWRIWSAIWLRYGMVYSTALSMTPSTSGINVSTSVFDAKLDIMNIHTDCWIHQTFLTHSINIMFNTLTLCLCLTVCLLQDQNR